MNTLIDVNILLDALIPERGFQAQAIACLDTLKQTGNALFFSASSIDNAVFILTRYLKRESESITKLREFFNRYQVHLLSVTGQEFIGLESCTAVEGAILSTAAKRVDRNFVVLTRDASFDSQGLKTIGYTVVQDATQKTADRQEVPILNLKREYAYIMEEVDAALLEAVAEAQYILGPQVKQFEQECAAYIGTKHAIGLASGTDALVLGLRALAIQRKGQEYFAPEDLILTTPFTFTATGDAILQAGATPLFVDVDLDTFNLDVEKVRERFTSSIDGSRVVGMIPVHLYGQSCDMDALMAIAEEHSLFVLEDVAQAFGGAWKGKKLGSIGTVGAFSFYPTKNLGGFGDGGLITTNDDELAELVKMLMRHGGKDKYNVDHIGYNSRLDTLQAVLLRVKLRHLDAFNEKRRAIAQFYDEGLQGLDLFQTPRCLEGASHVYHQYTIRVTNGTRDALQAHLQQKGIGSMVYYPLPLHQMRVFAERHIASGALENAERLCGEVLSLPIEPLMCHEELEYVVSQLKRKGIAP